MLPAMPGTLESQIFQAGRDMSIKLRGPLRHLPGERLPSHPISKAGDVGVKTENGGQRGHRGSQDQGLRHPLHRISVDLLDGTVDHVQSRSQPRAVLA